MGNSKGINRVRAKQKGCNEEFFFDDLKRQL